MDLFYVTFHVNHLNTLTQFNKLFNKMTIPTKNEKFIRKQPKPLPNQKSSKSLKKFLWKDLRKRLNKIRRKLIAVCFNMPILQISTKNHTKKNKTNIYLAAQNATIHSKSIWKNFMDSL